MVILSKKWQVLCFGDRQQRTKESRTSHGSHGSGITAGTRWTLTAGWAQVIEEITDIYAFISATTKTPLLR